MIFHSKFLQKCLLCRKIAAQNLILGKPNFDFSQIFFKKNMFYVQENCCPKFDFRQELFLFTTQITSQTSDRPNFSLCAKKNYIKLADFFILFFLAVINILHARKMRSKLYFEPNQKPNQKRTSHMKQKSVVAIKQLSPQTSDPRNLLLPETSDARNKLSPENQKPPSVHV